MRNIGTNSVTEVIFDTWRLAWTRRCSFRSQAVTAWHASWHTRPKSARS